MTPEPPLDAGALAGVRVIDCATLFAGPVIASMMADFGADVVKVEHPRGDELRRMGWCSEAGESFWWAVVARNKRCVTAKLSDPRGADLLKLLVQDADVLIENFRPGTMEKWGLGPEILQEINPGIVIVRTTGFGQTGPYSSLPGFGTLAEAISGFAYINGWPDRPPALPPLALGDGIAALTGCCGVMFALWWRDHEGNGRGQVIDLSIFEPLFSVLGPQAVVYDQLNVVQERDGNRAPFTAPRNAYRTSDGVWMALSASAQSIAERVMRIVGRADLIDQEWFSSHMGRLEHVDELDEIIQDWIGTRTKDEVLVAFRTGEAAIAPIYSIADIMDDPHYAARDALVRIPDDRLGSVLMQAPVPKLDVTPGSISHAGPTIGKHNRDVFVCELGLTEDTLDELGAEGIV